jgi:hypothetical protein
MDRVLGPGVYSCRSIGGHGYFVVDTSDAVAGVVLAY